jgi:ABC-type multidrug transport system fused ATPase/permease subunit
VARFGERQRIALAWAFPRNAPCSSSRNTTSFVGIKTEDSIIRCVECTKKDRTTILICHCWSTLGGCKLLLVIDQGEHIEVATEVSATIRGELLRGSLETVFYGAKANV